ncbi:hypothetical protein O3P69_020819 [Scylla paramamosain]|uniref:MADF domain-containing protein n=1 Tax=Scylla paramamosain TaxID=85552 RepID=A0AAW0TRY7_SCYPA
MSQDGCSYWPPEAVYTLLELVKHRDVLWQITHPDYYKKNIKRGLFNKICENLKVAYPEMDFLDTTQVLNKFQYLRGHFQKQLRRVEKHMNTCVVNCYKSATTAPLIQVTAPRPASHGESVPAGEAAKSPSEKYKAGRCTIRRTRGCLPGPTPRLQLPRGLGYANTDSKTSVTRQAPPAHTLPLPPPPPPPRPPPRPAPSLQRSA